VVVTPTGGETASSVARPFASDPRRLRRLIRTLQAGTLMMSCTYGVMFTMLDDYRDAYGIAEGLLGLVVAIGFFTSFVAQLTLAPLADRGHTKRLIVVGFLLVIAGGMAMGFGETATLILAGRFVMGVGGGMALPALRRVIIVADPEHLGDNMGRLVSVDVAGFALGPVIAVATVDTIGIPAPFVVISAVIVVILVMLLRVQVPETAEDERPSERFAFDLLTNRGVAGAVMIGLALFLMIGTFDSLWAVMMDDLEAPSWMANLGITLFVLPMVVLGPYGGRLSQRLGPYRMGSAGMLLGALFMCCYGLLPSPNLMMAVFLFHVINDGLTVTSAGIAVGMAAPPERQAGAQGLLGGVQTLMGGIAASAAGWSYDSLGRGVTFCASAILMALLIVAGYTMAGEHRTRRGAPEALEPAPA